MKDLRTPRGEALAQRIYDIIARDDFNPDHATDIRQCVEEALAESATSPSANRFDCDECGPGVAVDEDACCRGCGADATPIIGGEPWPRRATEPIFR